MPLVLMRTVRVSSFLQRAHRFPGQRHSMVCRQRTYWLTDTCPYLWFLCAGCVVDSASPPLHFANSPILSICLRERWYCDPDCGALFLSVPRRVGVVNRSFPCYQFIGVFATRFLVISPLELPNYENVLSISHALSLFGEARERKEWRERACFISALIVARCATLNALFAITDNRGNSDLVTS